MNPISCHQLQLAGLHDFSQRWLLGNDSYRPSQEPIRVAEFTVETLAKPEAKKFVETHHYSHSFVYEIASFGLWRKCGCAPSRLVGVASFATPSNPGSIRRWAGLDDFHQGAELGRFVLLDEVGGNGESFFLSQALKLLKAQRPELRVILSYSDPVPRLNCETNTIRFRGHFGLIYQATNAVFLGRASPKTLFLTKNGEAIPNRILTSMPGDFKSFVC